MTYNKAGIKIAIEKIDGFGKNPGLWIGTDNPNQMVKVASFGNEDKAAVFCKWFEYMIGVGEREAVRWDEAD